MGKVTGELKLQHSQELFPEPRYGRGSGDLRGLSETPPTGVGEAGGGDGVI